MDWMELNTEEIECPHCGNETTESIEFNLGEASHHGVNSGLVERECFECGKKYYFRAYCEFNVEVHAVYKTKPKVKKSK